MPEQRQLTKRKSFIFLLVLAALLFVGVLGGTYFIRYSPDFKIKEVSIINEKGIPVSNPEDFFRLDGDLNLFSFDMERIVQDIQARHPELDDVFIRKHFPHKLLIQVLEREPVAIVALRDSYLVDADAFILPFKFTYKNLPKIIGIDSRQIELYAQSPSLRLKSVLSLLKELKKAEVCPAYKVSRVDVRRDLDVAFYLGNKIEVKMGRSNFQRKVALLNEILAKLKEKGTVPKYIDMRFDNPAVLP